MLHLLPATLPPLRRVWQLHPCPHPQQCLLSMWGGCAALQISSHPTPPIPILPMWSMTLCTCIPAQPSPWPQEWRTPCMSPALVFGSSCFESGWEEPSAGCGGGAGRYGGAGVLCSLFPNPTSHLSICLLSCCKWGRSLLSQSTPPLGCQAPAPPAFQGASCLHGPSLLVYPSQDVI